MNKVYPRPVQSYKLSKRYKDLPELDEVSHPQLEQKVRIGQLRKLSPSEPPQVAKRPQ